MDVPGAAAHTGRTMSASTTPAAASDARSALRLLLPAVVGGLVAGGAIVLLTAVAAGSDIGGDGWSLRGNGALVVPFALGTAVLAGGWTALALHAGRDARWRLLGVGAALVAAALGAAQIPLLALLGGDRAGGPALVSIGAAVLWTLAAPGAAVLSAHDQHSRPAWHLAAGVLLAVGLLAGLVAGIPALG